MVALIFWWAETTQGVTMVNMRHKNLCIKYQDELNIKIIKVRGPFYCKKCKKITADDVCKYPEFKEEVSGTRIRKALLNNLNIKDIFMRKEIVNLLRKQKIFIN